MPTNMSFQGLFIPVNTDEPVVKMDFQDPGQIDRLLGGNVEADRYDHDALIVRTRDSVSMDRNMRVVDYIVTQSESAAVLMPGQDVGPGFGPRGPVVIIGVTEHGQPLDVPQRIVDAIKSPDLGLAEEWEQSADQYVVGYTTEQDGLHQVEQIDGPQSYVEALFTLQGEFIDLINADDGFAFDADTARTELEQLGYGEDFEATVEGRTYFLMPADEGLSQDQGYGYGMSI